MKAIIMLAALMIVPIYLLYGATYQTNNTESNSSPFWDFYSDNRVSNKACQRGYAGIASPNDISGIALNPASLNIEGKWQLYFEYIYKDEVLWLFDDTYLKQLPLNFLVGAGFKVNDYLQSGILYFTKNSYKIDYGEILSYDGNGNVIETWQAYNNFKLYSFTIPIVLDHRGIIKLGINLNYNSYFLKNVMGNYTGEANFNKFVPEFGVIVFPRKNLSLGLTYLPETKERVIKIWSDGSKEEFQPNIFPKKIGIGGQYRLDTAPILFFVDYNYSNNSKEKGLADRHDIHLGLEYDTNDKIALRTGLFTQKDYRSKDQQWSDKVGEYDQIFTTLGGSYKLRSWTLNLAAMDSHLLSSGKIKQTIINAGIGYDFPKF